MKYAIAIVFAALIGLVGLGLIAAQSDDEPDHVPAQGYFERTWNEDGQPTEWAE